MGIMPTVVALGDFVYCSEDAFFLTPFMKLNLSPEGGSSVKFVELMGRRKASEILMTDHRLTAKEALQYGFINGIIAKEMVPKTDEPILMDIDSLPNLRSILNADP